MCKFQSLLAKLEISSRKVEPLLRIRQYLTDLGVWDKKKEAALLASAAAKVDSAVEQYLNTPKPDVESMFDYMYAEWPEQLEEQRQNAIRYGGKNED